MSPWTVLGWLLVTIAVVPALALVLGLADGLREVLRRRP